MISLVHDIENFLEEAQNAYEERREEVDQLEDDEVMIIGDDLPDKMCVDALVTTMALLKSVIPIVKNVEEFLDQCISPKTFKRRWLELENQAQEDEEERHVADHEQDVKNILDKFKREDKT
jgi:3-deoxy-D-manno-octulosonate 8-phosphate phosphatase KdsC-like HAD superfamily phosphatase